MMFIDELFVSKFVFYDVFFSINGVINYPNIFCDDYWYHIGHLTLRKICAIAKIGSRVKCGFRRAGCEASLCKVPGKVRGRTVALRRSGAFGTCVTCCA